MVYLSLQHIDGPVAIAVKASITRHLWYLTEPLIVFSLFDDALDLDIKQAIAQKLSQTLRPESFETGKPAFPEMKSEDIMLQEFVGPSSWLLFERLHMTGDWLTLPAPLWDTAAEYIAMSAIVKHIAVVNDAAERGIKDIQDYANVAQDGTHRERIVLVTHAHRKMIPDFKKKEMDKCF